MAALISALNHLYPRTLRELLGAAEWTTLVAIAVALISSIAVADEPKDYSAPVVISGRALNADNKPIAGAAIYLASQGPGYKRIAETKTNDRGEYLFDKVELPIKRTDAAQGDDSGGFEVFGMAEGYAIAWREQKWFYPNMLHYRNEPADPDADKPRGFGAADPIRIDLRFGPPTTISGRILDDAGNPIRNTLIDIRYADCEWNATNFKSYAFKRALSSLNEQDIVPRDFKTRRTDADGRFEFAGLPFDHRFTIWIHPPGFPVEIITAVTNDTVDVAAKGPKVFRREIDLKLPRPRKAPIQVVFGDTGKPAPQVFVSAGGASGTTNSQGLVDLAVPDGKYRLHLTQRIHTPYRPTETDLTVSADSVQKPARAELQPAAVVDIVVVDADSGEPLEGVDVWREERFPAAPQPHRSVYGYRSWEVETRISHYEQPRTNADGKVRVYFDRGKHRIGVALEAYPAGYDPVDRDGELIDVEPGKPLTMQFELQK